MSKFLNIEVLKQSFKFNDLIQIDSSYFRVDRISNYNPASNSLTKVSLLKVNSLNIKSQGSASSGIIAPSPPDNITPIPNTARQVSTTNLDVGGGSIVKSGISIGRDNFIDRPIVAVGSNINLNDYSPDSIMVGSNFEILESGLVVTMPTGLVVNNNGNFFEGLPFNVDVFKGGENQVLYRGNQRQYIVLNANIENKENY